MKKILQLGSATIVGGLFFLAPLVLLIMALLKVLNVLRKLTQPITRSFEGWRFGVIEFPELLTVLILLLLCLAAGLLARTSLAKKAMRYLETRILVHLPGYEVMKMISGDQITADDQQELEIVFAQTDAGWQLAFLIEQLNDDLFVIFIPDAPRLRSGAIVYAEKNKIRHTKITRKEAIRTIRRMGAGSSITFKDKL